MSISTDKKSYTKEKKYFKKSPYEEYYKEIANAVSSESLQKNITKFLGESLYGNSKRRKK